MYTVVCTTTGWSYKELFLLLFFLVDAGVLGTNGCFVVWKCELAWFDSFVGVRLLLTAVADCRGSVLILMSLVTLFTYGLGKGDLLVNFVWSWNASNFVNGGCLQYWYAGWSCNS